MKPSILRAEGSFPWILRYTHITHGRAVSCHPSFAGALSFLGRKYSQGEVR